MTRDEFIGWLESVGVDYDACSDGATVDVYGKGYKMVDKTGETIDCIPIITVGGFGADRLCCRKDTLYRASETALKEGIKEEYNK